MNRLEEIQEIINNFIYEKQQMRQEITEIENKRNEIAKRRNEIKFVKGKANEVFAQNARAEIVELGKQIAELGNQSQDLQNRLNSRYIEVQKQVNIRIDTLISEGIREIRKIEEENKDLEEKIYSYEARKAKYEVQRQEFLAKFGRIPELSADAVKDMEIQEQEFLHNKEIIGPLKERIKIKEQELSELAKYKRAFKNSNWSVIIKEETKEEKIDEISELNVVNTNLQSNAEDDSNNEDDNQDDIDALLTAVEEAISPTTETVDVDNEIQEISSAEEETITLPLMDSFKEQEEVEVEYIEPLEEINLEDIQPIEEISLEDIQPIQDIKIEEIEPIEEVKVEEVKVEEIAEPEDLILEDIQPIEEIKVENAKIEDININEVKNEEEQTIKIDTLENIDNLQNDKTNNDNIEEDIITYEESLEETREIPTLNGKVTLMNIIVKIEKKELVYKAQLSNGKEISIYPTKSKQGNLLLKYKENIEEIKEILINYAVAEYRVLDKKIIKKIDPIICEILTIFAKQYNYDAQSLIYNYSMSFSKYEEYEADAIPNIIYNVSYLEGTNLTKKEKEILSKICKSAKKNEKIDIIGCNTGFSKIRYILKRTFNTNNSNALPEGKY